MANPFQQQQRLRKFIYIGLILALFTISLLHRRLGVEPRATRLQLREVALGEVELTSSAVRLTLTGSRGLAVTMLWAAAIKKQELHEWNEVELLVSSITKLQPYFITPWLFQSWNLAFNVAVECDQPRDKYYYVSRGLELLAEGERRNFKEGLSPGSPDMRFHLGFTYQLKISTSDEKNAMRCLLDMSSIDPARRDPERLWTAGERGKVVHLEKFQKFCEAHPRLVRRLPTHLRCNTPDKVVRFLSENREIPSRFEQPDPAAFKSDDPPPTGLKKPAQKQFPILPPRLGDAPDPTLYDYGLKDEDMDVAMVARTWYAYAQQPLPPTHKEPGVTDPPFERLKNRIPKRMSIYIFRGYPARAQVYIAENLQEEGWFDSDGWTITDWFRPLGIDVQVGHRESDKKYHSRPAWDKSYLMYLDYGIKNGLYLFPSQQAKLEEQAQVFRTARGKNLQPHERINLPAHEMDDNAKAHVKLAWNLHYRHMTQFDAHLDQANAERGLQATNARKFMFRAEYLRRFEQAFEEALAVYEEAWPLWLDVLLQHPGFRTQIPVQEDVYEVELKYLRLFQGQRAEVLKPLTMGFAQMSVWPHLPLDQIMISDKEGTRPLVTATDQLRIIPIRTVRGPLESVVVYNGPHAEHLKMFFLVLTQGASQPPMLVFFPGQHQRMLATTAWRNAPVGTGFSYLFPEHLVQSVRDRLGIPRPTETPPAAVPVMQK